MISLRPYTVLQLSAQDKDDAHGEEVEKEPLKMKDNENIFSAWDMFIELSEFMTVLKLLSVISETFLTLLRNAE